MAFCTVHNFHIKVFQRRKPQAYLVPFFNPTIILSIHSHSYPHAHLWMYAEVLSGAESQANKIGFLPGLLLNVIQQSSQFFHCLKKKKYYESGFLNLIEHEVQSIGTSHWFNLTTRLVNGNTRGVSRLKSRANTFSIYMQPFIHWNRRQ